MCSIYRFLNNQLLEATRWAEVGTSQELTSEISQRSGRAAADRGDKVRAQPGPAYAYHKVNSTPQVSVPQFDPTHPVAPPLPGEEGGPAVQRQHNFPEAQPPTTHPDPPSPDLPPKPNRHQALTYRVPKLNCPYASLET